MVLGIFVVVGFFSGCCFELWDLRCECWDFLCLLGMNVWFILFPKARKS